MMQLKGMKPDTPTHTCICTLQNITTNSMANVWNCHSPFIAIYEQ